MSKWDGPPTALGMDDYLHNATLEEREYVRKLTPTWYKDQMDAACDDTVQLVELLEKNTANSLVDAKDFDGWLRLSILDTLAQWIGGKATTCMHIPDPLRPQPIMAAAWKPGLVACIKCAHLFILKGEADLTCDCCGHVCGTDEYGNKERIRIMTIALRSLIYLAGVCENCRLKVDCDG